MLKIAFDCIDVTPDENGWIGFAAPANPQPPRDPLFARLFLLRDDKGSALVISLDYGGLYCSAHDLWRRELAEAAGIPFNRVILHCLHQHDAPFINIEAAEMMKIPLDWSWFDKVKTQVRNAVLALPGKLAEVTSVGWSETRVHGYASNRRILTEEGRIAVRWSRCADEKLRSAPVGLIDPMLRTLGFFGTDGSLIAAWSFYATHPQVANEGRRFSADAPGEAARLLKERFPGTQNSLFNGCFGNVTAGKYSSFDDLEGNILHFGKLIADAVTKNLRSMELVKVESFEWKQEVFPFPVRRFTEAELAERAAASPAVAAALAAGDAYGKLNGEEYAVEMVELGDVKILFLNGELFIEYQLFAQSLIPDEKLAVAGNCGDTFYYIGTAEDLRDPDGYEVKSFCRVMPEFEELFKSTLRRMLVK